MLFFQNNEIMDLMQNVLTYFIILQVVESLQQLAHVAA